MATLDSKKNGRFIKKGDPLVKVLSITDFNLADICQTPLTFHDNASANIIHQKLHLTEDLEETVRESHEIEQVFTVPEERMIIQPLDFTEEWARLKKRQSSRTQKTDDDEDFDLEQVRQAQEDKEASLAKEALPEEFGPGGLLDIPEQKTNHSQQATAPKTPSVAVPTSIPTKALIPETKNEEAPPEQISAQEDDEILHDQSHEEEGVDDFVPYAAQSSPKNPQVSPLERYPTEEELEAIREMARQEGFRQGFQSGEERATLEARSKVQAIMEEVANVVHNLEGMQHAILKNAQENFQAISQNLIEALIHKEFHLHPDSFGHVIERAISEGLAEDEFKIFVNPEIAKELKAWSNKELASRIKPDESLEAYNFRVEGQNASIDANFQQIIQDLLQKADLKLFDDNEKAG